MTRCTVAVVGAGFGGVSVVDALARHGIHDVVVVDERGGVGQQEADLRGNLLRLGIAAERGGHCRQLGEGGVATDFCGAEVIWCLKALGVEISGLV